MTIARFYSLFESLGSCTSPSSHPWLNSVPKGPVLKRKSRFGFGKFEYFQTPCVTGYQRCSVYSQANLCMCVWVFLCSGACANLCPAMNRGGQAREIFNNICCAFSTKTFDKHNVEVQKSSTCV